MATINERFGILNASQVKLRSRTDNKLLLKIPQANKCTFEYKTTDKSAKEQGIEKLFWSTTPVATYKMETETISFAQLAEALGSEGLVLNTENESYYKEEVFSVTTDGTLVLTLKSEPMTGTPINFHKLSLGGELDLPLVGVVDGTDKKKFTITNSELKIGDKVEVNYTEVLSAGQVYTFKVYGNRQVDAKELQATVLRKNVATNKIELMDMIIPNVVVQSGVTLSFDAENPSKFEITFKVLGDPFNVDPDGNPLFCEFKAKNPNATAPISTISDLSASSLVAGQSSLTFTAPTGATSVDVMYKLSTDATYSTCATSGTTGVYLNGGAVTATSTSALVKGLTSGSSYNFKVVVTGGTFAGTSNVSTVTVA
jgi:hypothetical protein